MLVVSFGVDNQNVYTLFRYSVGDMPVWCLKYFPKNDWVEKFSW